MYRFDRNCHKQEILLMVFTLLFFLLFSFLIVRLTRRGPAPLSTWEVLASFGFKVLMACAYGYVFLHYYGGDDTWRFHTASVREYQLMIKDPGTFFWEWTPGSAWRKSATVWEAFRYYLVDLEYILLVKPMGIFNFFSRGNYYANAVYFSFLSFWGHYWLFRLLAGLFPSHRRILLLLVFFFPPVVFWLSGIRMDGLLFTCFSLTLLHSWRWIVERRHVSLLYVLLGLAGMLVFRSALVLLLLPALLGWFISTRYDRRPAVVFGMVYAAAVLVFLGSAYIPGLPNLPGLVAARQQEFLALEGNTRFRLDALDATAGSFLRVLPQALGNTFLRPFVWEARGPLQWMAALEILFFWGLALLARWRRDRSVPDRNIRSLLWVLLIFSVSLYLFIGYVTPFPGAIVRYKAIPELLLMALMTIKVKREK